MPNAKLSKIVKPKTTPKESPNDIPIAIPDPFFFGDWNQTCISIFSCLFPILIKEIEITYFLSVLPYIIKIHNNIDSY
jgi:hypothetical protein